MSLAALIFWAGILYVAVAMVVRHLDAARELLDENPEPVAARMRRVTTKVVGLRPADQAALDTRAATQRREAAAGEQIRVLAALGCTALALICGQIASTISANPAHNGSLALAGLNVLTVALGAGALMFLTNVVAARHAR